MVQGKGQDDSGVSKGPANRALSRRSILAMGAVGAAATLIPASSLFLRAQGNTWSRQSIPPQHGRVAIVTGGNGYPEDDRSGLGFHVALGLAQAGADVTIASRNRVRGEEAVRRIRASLPSAMVRFESLDLTSMTSVRAFSALLLAKGKPVDMLVNNAGVMGRLQRQISVDGTERVFASNTLGHFGLTGRILPLLRKALQPRVVWVSSMRATGNLPDFDQLVMPDPYDYGLAYNRSKLANLMLAIELDRRSKAEGWNITAVAAHPGVARTNLIPDGPGMDSAEGWRLRNMPFMFQPAEEAAMSLLYAATVAPLAGGSYIGPSGFGGLGGAPDQFAIPGAAKDEAPGQRLWSQLEGLSGVTYT